MEDLFLSIDDRYKFTKQILEEEKHCFHPSAPDGCSLDGPIKSHSISRSTSFAAIAENGHVISIVKPFDDIVFDDKANVEPAGIKISSVFPGFCEKHDFELFSSIEKEGWIINKESCFLLSYRSLSYTTLTSRMKIRYFEHMNLMAQKRIEMIKSGGLKDEYIRRDYDFEIFARRYLGYVGASGKNMNIDDKLRKNYAWHAKARVLVADMNPQLNTAKFFDKKNYIKDMKDMFIEKDYDRFRCLAYTYNCVLPFVASKTIRVRIISEEKEALSFLNLNVCSNKKNSFIIFGWIEDDGVVEEYIETLMANEENKIVNKVLGYLFKNPTNSFFQESWWSSLADETKHIVVSYHDNELNAFPEKMQLDDDYNIFIPEFPPTSCYRK